MTIYSLNLFVFIQFLFISIFIFIVISDGRSKNMHRAIFLEVSRNLLPQKVLDTYCENRQLLQKILSSFKLKNIDADLASPVVLLYGSTVSGTAFAQGDADFAVVFPTCTTESRLLNNVMFHEVTHRDQASILSNLLEHINKGCSSEFYKPHRVFFARVPIIQYVKKINDEHLKIDLSLSLHGVENSLLIRRYMESQPQLRFGALCVKCWGRKMKIINSKNGWISGYTLTILYIFFMIRTGRISDPVDESEVSKQVRAFIIDYLDSRNSLDDIPEFTKMLPLQECDVEAVAHDVIDFFHFYGDSHSFDFDMDVIDIRKNDTVKKKEEWLGKLAKLDEKERCHLLGYENIMARDPFESHNLARSVDFFRGETIREAFRTSLSKKSPINFLYDILH